MADELYTEEYFRITMGGEEVELVTSVVIPSATFVPNDFKHETDQKKPTATKVPGRVNWQDVSVGRLMSDNTNVWDWFVQGLPDEGGGAATIEKKEVIIELCDADGGAIKTWTLEGAWITSFQASGNLNAAGGDVLQEQFSLHYDKCTVS